MKLGKERKRRVVVMVEDDEYNYCFFNWKKILMVSMVMPKSGIVVTCATFK